MTPRWRNVARSRDEVESMRRELRALYDEVDALFGGTTCDASTECCRFGITGREPYPTAVELAELFEAIGARGIALHRKGGAKRGEAKKGEGKRKLPIADERICPLLDDEGGTRAAGDPSPARCRVYAARPFGCRTFFCDRAEGPKVPRAEVQALSRRLADLSARAFPADPRARPLTRALVPDAG